MTTACKMVNIDFEAVAGVLSRLERHIQDSIEHCEETPRRRNKMSSSAEDPEWEKHSSGEVQSPRQQELQDRLNEVSSLRELFIQQSEAIALLRKQDSRLDGDQKSTTQKTEISPERAPSDIDGLSSRCVVDQGSLTQAKPVTKEKTIEETMSEITMNLNETFEKALAEPPATILGDLSCGHSSYRSLDEDASIQFDFENTDSEIANAILEIRKEASRVDAAVALDQLGTLQAELSNVVKSLSETTSEVEKLRNQLDERDEQLASLELERDLFKADASKLREDLSTCVHNMFDVTMNAGYYDDDQSLEQKSAETVVETKTVAAVSPSPQTPPATLRIDPKLSQEVFQAFQDYPSDENKPPKPPLDHESTFDVPIATRKSSNRKPLSTLRRSVRMRSSSDSQAICARTKDRKKLLNRGRTRHLCKDESCLSLVSEMDVAEEADFRYGSATQPNIPPHHNEESGTRMCGFFRRRSADSHSEARLETERLRSRINELEGAFTGAESRTHVLRKRLALITRYYEGLIRKLNERLAAAKQINQKQEVEMSNLITSLEREHRVSFVKLETSLRQRDMEIARLTNLMSI